LILFSQNRNLDLLERSKRWYTDWTFRIATRLFSQVLVLLAEEHGGVHPIIYRLLPNKNGDDQRFLDMTLGLRANMNPDSISCDYEIALFNTVSAGFPNAEIFGCFSML